MYTVYVAARDDLRVEVGQAVKGIDGAILNGSTINLRQALEECAGDLPGALVVDDRLLAENVGLLEHLGQLPYPIIVIGGEDPGAARRALAVRARDLIGVAQWKDDLPGALARVAQPLEAAHTAPQGRVIVVFSSKGGVGKTTIAVNLAFALSKVSRRQTALVDLDLQFGDVAPLVGDLPRTTLHDLVMEPSIDHGRVDRVMIPVADTRVKFMAAPLEPQEAEDVRAEHVVRILQLLKEKYGYVIVDTAPGYTEVNVAALDFCDEVLTICTPDVVTVRTVGQALRLFFEGFRYPPGKVRIVLNRAGSRTGVEAQDIARTLDNPIDFQLPSDGAWPVKAANQGKPLMLLNPDSPMAKGLVDMARVLVERTEGPSRAVVGRTANRSGGGRVSFWDRLRSK